MRGTSQQRVQHPSTDEIRRRGADLNYRFRLAGLPHYFVWLCEYKKEWVGDTELAARIRRIFNGRGSKRDLSLIKECEVIADKYLPKSNVAA
jgi:hypothetical protein